MRVFWLADTLEPPLFVVWLQHVGDRDHVPVISALYSRPVAECPAGVAVMKWKLPGVSPLTADFQTFRIESLIHLPPPPGCTPTPTSGWPSRVFSRDAKRMSQARTNSLRLCR
jgi:hypothetical protein